MAAVYFVAVLFILGLTQGNSAPRVAEPDFVENLRNGGQRIVAGWEAVEGQFPHQTSIRMVDAGGSITACGGSVIHSRWVLTAAHCLFTAITSVIRFGLTDLTRPEYIAESTRMFNHPEYDMFQVGGSTDDIALIALEQNIPFGPNVQPCRLQNSERKNFNFNGIRLTVSGFGLTDDTWNGGSSSPVLRWVYLLGITNAECLTWYPSAAIIREQTLCALFYNDTSQSACQEDSGGPLILDDDDGKPTLVGVVSFSSSLGCNSLWPSGFVRPGHYHDWFLEVTGINFDWSQSDIQRQNTINANEKPIVVNF